MAHDTTSPSPTPATRPRFWHRPLDAVACVAGAGLLLAAGGIHLDLYLTGYRDIPTIGVLFLLQFAAAVVLAVALIAAPGRLVAATAAGFAASTIGGYVLSLWTGLFGFNEVRTTAGVVAGAIEVAAVGVIGSYAAYRAPAHVAARASGALRAPGAQRPVRPRPLDRDARRAIAPITFLAALALVLATANAPGASPGPTDAGRSPQHTGGGARPRGDAAGTVAVSISNFAFVPAKVTVSPDERVVVTNHDSVTHTFTATPGSAPDGHFGSGDIAPGATVTVVAPSAPGTYAFECAIHPFMTGTLVVR